MNWALEVLTLASGSDQLCKQMKFNQISAGANCLYLDGQGCHEGEILGKDNSIGDEFVWALVHGRKAIFQFHPSNAAVDANGTIVFCVYDREMSVQKVVAQRTGDGTTPMFYYAKNSDDMLCKVKAWALILP
jgi:hypothetical protein